MDNRFLSRAKRKEDGKWMIGYYQKRYEIDGSEQHLIFFAKSQTVWEYAEIDPETLCQCSGISDKNEKLIWENDIVKDKRMKYRVIWSKEEGSWALQSDSGAMYGIGSLNSKVYEVIGNIFDDANIMEEEKVEFGIVLKEKNLVDGLTKGDVMDLFDMLSDTEAYPIELLAKEHESSAMGFITPAAAELCNYDYEKSGLHNFIADILDDMKKESEDCQYEFNGIKIWLSR